jgi:hypothetical protein
MLWISFKGSDHVQIVRHTPTQSCLSPKFRKVGDLLWLTEAKRTHEWRCTAEVRRSLNLVTSQSLGYTCYPLFRSYVATGTHCVRRWVDPTTGLEVVAEKNTSTFFQRLTLGLRSLMCHVTDWYIPLYEVVESFICFTLLEEANHVLNLRTFIPHAGARGGAVVEALRYKPEGRVINSR